MRFKKGDIIRVNKNINDIPDYEHLLGRTGKVLRCTSTDEHNENDSLYKVLIKEGGINLDYSLYGREMTKVGTSFISVAPTNEPE